MGILIKYSTEILVIGLCIMLVNGADFRARPSSIIIGGQNPTLTMNITCSPNDPEITSVFSIDIGRKSQEGTEIPIIRITNTTLVVILDTSYTWRISTSGSISGSRGSLTMSLRYLRCEDAALYYCKTSINTASSSASDDGTVSVTSQTNPGTINMIVTPRKTIYMYNVGEEVTFSCHGAIGNREGSMDSLWKWQYRNIRSFNPVWKIYPNTDNSIVYEPKQPSGNCQYTSRTVLTYVVKSTDNGRQFRCFFSREIYQTNYTLYIETGPVVRSTPSTSDRVTRYHPGQEISFNTGMAIGKAVLFVLIALCLVVTFIFRRKVGACLTGTTCKGTDRSNRHELDVTSQSNNITELSATPADQINTSHSLPGKSCFEAENV